MPSVDSERDREQNAHDDTCDGHHEGDDDKTGHNGLPLVPRLGYPTRTYTDGTIREDYLGHLARLGHPNNWY